MINTKRVSLAASSPTMILAGNTARRGWLVKNLDEMEAVRIKIGSVPGTADVVAQQTISFLPNTPSGGSWKARYNGGTTSALAHNISSSDLQTALRTLPGLASVTVTGSVSAGFVVTMTGAEVLTPLIAIVENTLVDAGTAQVETLTLDRAPDQGSFRLQVDFPNDKILSPVVSPIFPFNFSAAQIQTFLRGIFNDPALTFVDGMDLSYTLTHGKTGVRPRIQVIENRLKKAEPTWEKQLITFSAVPASGSFRITYGEGTATLDFDQTHETLQILLRLIEGLEDVVVTGDYDEGFEVEFVNVGDADLMVIDQNTLEDESMNPVDDDVQVTQEYVAAADVEVSLALTTPGTADVAVAISNAQTTAPTLDDDGESVAAGGTLDRAEDGGTGKVFAYATAAIELDVSEVF